MKRDRRGFTLVELLVVAVLGSLVVLAALQVLITNQRTYTAQNAVISGQQSTRMALEVLFQELRLVSPAGGDILMMSQDSLRVRIMRKFSRTCVVSLLGAPVPTAVVLDIGPVDFAIGDSVFVYADNDPKKDNDDRWLTAAVTGVAAGVCPQNASAGLTLTFAGQQAKFVADSVRIGAPVRSFTPVTFGLTTYSGGTYLGRREGAGAWVPIAGPLRAGTGIEFVYRNALGAVTNVPANVRQIVVRIRSGSPVINSLGNPITDSITAWVYTRN
jgi:prepilin-type N-terminal cleavage/methylation domain-containing protein